MTQRTETRAILIFNSAENALLMLLFVYRHFYRTRRHKNSLAAQ